MRIYFESSRRHIYVPPGCPVWTDADGTRIPIVHMETQHIRNVRKYLLRVGRIEAARCYVLHEGVARGVLDATEFFAWSVERLNWMNTWYGRLGTELKARGLHGEEDTALVTADGPKGITSPSWRVRVYRVVDSVRNLLSA